MSSISDPSSFTYEHRIIQEARFIATSLKDDGTIFNNKVSPKTVNILRIFSRIEEGKPLILPEINGVSNLLQDFTKLVHEYYDSNLENKSIRDFSKSVMKALNEISLDPVTIKNFAEVFLESLLLQEILISSGKREYRIINGEIIDGFLEKLNNAGNNEEILDFMQLLKGLSETSSIGELSSDIFKDIVHEGNMQLIFAKMLSKSIKGELVNKIKMRRLSYIKNLVEKLNLFENAESSVLKPSENLIYGILFSACVLHLLSYRNTISLNYDETLKYIDKEIQDNTVEKMISEERKKAITNALHFSVSLPLEKFGINWSGTLPLHKVMFIYFIIWVFATLITSLYLLKIIYSSILVVIIIPIYLYLIGLTISIIYQSRKKGPID